MDNLKEKLQNIELFLLDMDGTIYLDEDLFDGSLEFINTLIDNKTPYIFLTNNSSKNTSDYVKKLNRLMIPGDEKNIFTSGDAMGIYLNKNYPNRKIYLVGTKSLHEQLRNANIIFDDQNPDIVVIGFDRELNYQKLEKACEFIDHGAIFLATNCDIVCPIKDHRYIPDCGSICQMITNATGKIPTYIGKPSPEMIYIISNKLNIPTEKIAVVGDRVYTDITAGYNANSYTICVLSGESTMDTINKSTIKPNLIVNSVKDLIQYLKK